MKKLVFPLIVTFMILGCQSNDTKTTTATTASDSASKTTAFNSVDKAGDTIKAIIPEGSGPVDTSNFTTIQWIDKKIRPLPKIKEGEVIEITYRFKNTGNKPLIVQDVSASCGCTVPEKPQEPILPGKEGLIKAKFDSHNKVGTNTKTLTVLANTNGDKILTFSVEVEK